MPVVLFKVDSGQYAPRGQAAGDSTQEKSSKKKMITPEKMLNIG
jgi:hypothetical protein